jgi:iron complex outermembrane receptor protein
LAAQCASSPAARSTRKSPIWPDRFRGLRHVGQSHDPKAALIGSRLFANDTLGVLSATYEKRSLWYDQAKTTGWRQIRQVGATAAQCSQTVQTGCVDRNGDGMGDFYPDIPRYAMYRERTERYAFNGIVEWRPSDKFRLFFDNTYTRGLQTLNSQLMQINTFSALTPALTLGMTPVSTRATRPAMSSFSKRRWPTPTAQTRWACPIATSTAPLTARPIPARWGRNGRSPQADPACAGRLFMGAAYNDEIDVVGTQYGLTSVTVDYRNAAGAPTSACPPIPPIRRASTICKFSTNRARTSRPSAISIRRRL